MASTLLQKIRRLNIATHRDLGYFFSSLIIIYCISGIALNHVDDWNPDFIISKRTINIPITYMTTKVTKDNVMVFSRMVGEEKFKVIDNPTHDQTKIYFDNATLHLNFSNGTGVYESISRRPVFYHVNVIHKNSLKGWRWASDVFAVMLVLVSVTGLFILKGKNGFLYGRGKWFALAGILPPILVWIIHSFI